MGKKVEDSSQQQALRLQWCQWFLFKDSTISKLQLSRTRSRKERLLRYVLRRRPCIVLLLLELILIALLCLACYSLFVSSLNVAEEHLRIKEENRMLDDYKNYKSFTECVYEVDGGEYNTSKCIEDDDEHAYMRKVYKVIEGENCIHRIDYVPCNLGGHGIYDFKVERLERFPQCSGMRGVNISSIITAQTPIYAPSVSIAKYKDRILRVKDFYMRCPMCVINSRFEIKVDKEGNITRCARDIRTIREGWPEPASSCDEAQVHEVTEYCNLYRKTVTHLLGRY